jgi:hypothetical protein
MRDVNVTRLDVIAALRSRIIETVNNTQKLGYPPNPEDIFDRVCGFVSGPVSGQVPIETALPAEVCERMRRDGGSVFPAHANTGDPNGPLRPR